MPLERPNRMVLALYSSLPANGAMNRRQRRVPPAFRARVADLSRPGQPVDVLAARPARPATGVALSTFLQKRPLALVAIGLMLAPPLAATGPDAVNEFSLALPALGAHELRVLSPSVLELTLVTTKQPDPARPEQWDFVDPNFQLRLPGRQEFSVSVADQKVPVESVGFKRRVL